MSVKTFTIAEYKAWLTEPLTEAFFDMIFNVKESKQMALSNTSLDTNDAVMQASRLQAEIKQLQQVLNFSEKEIPKSAKADEEQVKIQL